MTFPKVGNMAPAFTLPDQHGNKFSLKQFKGQSKPECWCGDLPSGVPGGCQGGHVCCQNNCTDLVNCQVGG